MTGLSLALGLQPLPQGEEKVPDSDVNAPNVHLAVLQDLSPRQTKLTDAFADLLEHLRGEFKIMFLMFHIIIT